MKINTEKIVLYVVLLTLAVGASVIVFGKAKPQSIVNEVLNKTASETLAPEKKKTTFKKYHEIVKPAGFVNTNDKPITIGEFVGKKVVLIDFVTYSCINCQRTFPYLSSWHDKYNDKGLQIIAIHTPEFAFEHKKENVEKAFKDFGLKFPAVLDNDYNTWNAWGNSYWPRKYLIDIDGYVVYDHIGEGKYEETETKIIDLLNERNARLGQPKIEGGSLTKSTEKNLLNIAISPETYLGSQRADKQYGKALMCESGSCSYGDPIDIPNDKFSLSGKWKQVFENIGLVEASGSLFYNYTAGKVHLVADADTPVTAQVFIDGDIIDNSIAGSDVKNGQVVFSESRLYNLVDSKKVESHLLELRFEKPGVRGYAFTFGQ
jgi:thiol-disulfide isomerase/thioredoxin